MRKQSLFLIFLVFIILGCTIPNGQNQENDTYMGVGVVSFTSDLYNFPANTITGLNLQLFNYGDYDARNIQSSLIGYQGSESYVIPLEGSHYEEDILTKNNALNFFWQLRFLDPGVYSDITYSVDTRTYYEYESNATKEIIFTFESGIPSITAGSGQTSGPINVSLSSQDFVYIAGDSADFTVTVRIDNVDGGYPVCRRLGTGDTLNCPASHCRSCGTSEDESYRNYIKSIELYIPDTWNLKKPDEWGGGCTSSGSNLQLCTYAPDFSNSADVDMRLYLTQGLRNVFNIGFIRNKGSSSDEIVESMKIVLKYSYVVSSPNIDLTVQGAQQTY